MKCQKARDDSVLRKKEQLTVREMARMLGRTPVPPLALAGRHACRCRWLPRSSSSSGGRRRGGDGGGNQRGYHATAVRREALSTADMVAWHDGASVVESVTPNGLIGVNGVMIQGSVMVLPRLCLLWHVKGLEVRACRVVSSHVVTCGCLRAPCAC